MPDKENRTKHADDNHKNQNPKWWNPIWTILLVVIFFAIAISLFIATRYYVGHPNDTPAFVAGIIGLLTLYAIIVQVAINRHQCQAMQDGLKQNRELFALVERPSLGIKRAFFEVMPNKTGQITVIMQNYGRTPATKIEVEFCTSNTFEVRDELQNVCPEPIPPTKIVGLESRGYMAVNGTLTTGADGITADKVKDIRDGTKWLYVWVKVNYWGVFHDPYHIEFFARYELGSKSFSACQNHNEAD